MYMANTEGGTSGAITVIYNYGGIKLWIKETTISSSPG